MKRYVKEFANDVISHVNKKCATNIETCVRLCEMDYISSFETMKKIVQLYDESNEAVLKEIKESRANQND